MTEDPRYLCPCGEEHNITDMVLTKSDKDDPDGGFLIFSDETEQNLGNPDGAFLHDLMDFKGGPREFGAKTLEGDQHRVTCLEVNEDLTGSIAFVDGTVQELTEADVDLLFSS